MGFSLKREQYTHSGTQKNKPTAALPGTLKHRLVFSPVLFKIQTFLLNKIK
jgi:hypothetical protein